MTSHDVVQRQTPQKRAIGPAGTVGRLLGGLGLLYMGIADLPLTWGLAWYEAVLGLIAFPLSTVVGIILWKHLAGTDSPILATGHFGLCANTAIGIALFATPFTQDAVALFAGATLMLAAARGYAGCEFTAVSNWLLRRNDQVGCIVFSPLDEVEARFRHMS